MNETLITRLFQLAQEVPYRECLRLRYTDQPEVVLTRQDLIAAIRYAAQQLQTAGAQAGDLVIIVQRDLLALVSTFFAACHLGAIPSILPFATEKLDPHRYRGAMAALIHLSHPAILATDRFVVEDVRALLPSDEDKLPNIAVVEGWNGDETPREISGHVSDPNAIALLQHSSGTTGLQKGVALSHRAIFEQLMRTARPLASLTM
jgi:acyl-CoA synthetase (AMP-forming)/AMP-acid ligase II